jgi:hypothetical protein
MGRGERSLISSLQELVQPYFLRRDKQTVFGMCGKAATTEKQKEYGSSCSIPGAPQIKGTLQLTATKREWTVLHALHTTICKWQTI